MNRLIWHEAIFRESQFLIIFFRAVNFFAIHNKRWTFRQKIFSLVNPTPTSGNPHWTILTSHDQASSVLLVFFYSHKENYDAEFDAAQAQFGKIENMRKLYKRLWSNVTPPIIQIVISDMLHRNIDYIDLGGSKCNTQDTMLGFRLSFWGFWP